MAFWIELKTLSALLIMLSSLLFYVSDIFKLSSTFLHFGLRFDIYEVNPPSFSQRPVSDFVNQVYCDWMQHTWKLRNCLNSGHISTMCKVMTHVDCSWWLSVSPCQPPTLLLLQQNMTSNLYALNALSRRKKLHTG